MRKQSGIGIFVEGWRIVQRARGTGSTDRSDALEMLFLSITLHLEHNTEHTVLLLFRFLFRFSSTFFLV